MQGGFPVALVGPKTHRFVNLHLSGRVDAFTIAFQIGGLRALFGLPVEEITNQDPDAEAVLGRGIGQLRQRLGECSSFEDRARTADAFLAAMCPDFIKSSSAVAAARLIHHRRGAVRVDELAHRAGLSARQLERRFRHEIGIAPKH
jgi:AraC-like DNA-binding protein